MTNRVERMARALKALSIMDAEGTDVWPTEAWIDRHWNGYSQFMRDGWLADARKVLDYVGLKEGR